MVLPLEAFTPQVRGRDGLQASCKGCEAARLQIRRHGLTNLEKEQLADEQHGCALCGRLEPGRKGWVVDHDRSCCPGDVSCPDCRRGVLCQWCNNALGYAMDNPTVLRRMADYLELSTRLDPDAADRLRQTRQSTDRSTDQITESVHRLATASPTDGRDGLTNKSLEDMRKSCTSVPHARIPNDHEMAAGTAALRASHLRTTPDAATEENR